MRVLLAILAVVGLLLSPVAASAAMLDCAHPGSAMMAMDMATPAGAAYSQNAGKPDCCDPGKGHGQTKHQDANCAQACATMCAVVAALPSAPMALIARPDHEAPPPARVASLKPHEPDRLERPPRSIA